MFIVLEGLDGAGKTTQVGLLSARLAHAGYQVLQVHEPGGTPLGERVRALLKHDVATPLSPMAELLLFAASRAQLVDTVIKPSLAAGVVVIADRFTGSTYAYQGKGRGLPAQTIEAVQTVACGDVTPDITLLLDITPSVTAQRRLRAEGAAPQPDRFEDEAEAFAQRVRGGYLSQAVSPPPNSGRRWVVVDGDLPPERVAAAIWDAVSATLEGG